MFEGRFHTPEDSLFGASWQVEKTVSRQARSNLAKLPPSPSFVLLFDSLRGYKTQGWQAVEWQRLDFRHSPTGSSKEGTSSAAKVCVALDFSFFFFNCVCVSHIWTQ